MKKTMSILSIIAICGCTSPNPYSQYYKDYTDGQGVIGNPIFVTTTNAPIIKEGVTPQDDALEMLRNGYNIIGESSFNAGPINTSLVEPHARKIGAEIVLIYYQYTDTVSGSVPLTLPNTHTSHSYGSAFTHGSYGYANTYGTSHTTTYGSKTIYVPYNTRRYNYTATYWAKANALTLGAQLLDLNDEQRRQIQSNKGAYVSIVVKESPAFHNDILEGDIIRYINGIEIIDKVHCRKILNDNNGKSITILILRDGQTLQKTVQLN